MESLDVAALALRIGLDSAVTVPITLLVLWLARSFIERFLWTRLDDRAKERLEQLKSQLNIQANVETERMKANLLEATESYRLALKKSEFMFGKQYEATSAFTGLYECYNPRAIRPDMDWHDACEDIGQRCAEIETALVAFIGIHGAVLTTAERDQVNRAISSAANGKFGPIDGDEDLASIGEDAWNRLRETRDLLLTGLHGQVRH